MVTFGALLVAWSGMVASTTVWAALCPKSRAGTFEPGLVPRRLMVVRPCAGKEPRLGDTLASTATAFAKASVRVAVASERDEAWPASLQAIAKLRAVGMDAQLVVTGALGPNRKADQIARVLQAEQPLPDLVVIADSDVELTSVSVSALLARMQDPRVGASWAPPVEIAPTTMADRASCAVLDSSMHSFAVLYALDCTVLCGKLMAIRGDALRAIGGFSTLRSYLGEDMELSRLLRRAGYSVCMASTCAFSLAGGRGWRDVLSRYARWITVVRAQRPAWLLSYPALLAATPLILIAAACDARSDSRMAAIAAGIAVGARLAAPFVASGRLGRAARPLSLVRDALLADLLLLAAFLCALLARGVVWRGRSLRVAHGGILSEGTR